jgi:nucleotide-binding universal stress UspA family protein
MFVSKGFNRADGAATVLEEAKALAADIGEDLHAVHVVERSELVDVLEKSVDGQSFGENYEVQQVGENIASRAADSARRPGRRCSGASHRR